MFTLNTDPQPRWIDLPQGVKVQVRPLDAVIAAAANNAGLTDYLAQKAAAEEAAKAGAPLDPRGANVTNADYGNAMLGVATAQALGRFGIIAWEGVYGPDKRPLPFTAAGAEALAAHPLIRNEFMAKYQNTLTDQVEEGNGSASSAPGGTAEGSRTAEDASPEATTETPATPETVTEAPAPEAVTEQPEPVPEAEEVQEASAADAPDAPTSSTAPAPRKAKPA